MSARPYAAASLDELWNPSTRANTATSSSQLTNGM
jgi:hypothetical protein